MITGLEPDCQCPVEYDEDRCNSISLCLEQCAGNILKSGFAGFACLAICL
jgi:hypothetical protein